MSHRVEDPLLNHEYDGIREYDNPTPGWWHAIFLGTVLFSAGYALFWHVSPYAPSIQEQWDRRQVAYYKEVFGAIGDLAADEPTIIEMMSNEQMMAVAQGIFRGNCAQCHAADGGGLAGSGVNLTDDQYKNVQRIEDLHTVIAQGAANGAMPRWDNVLSPNERVILTSYVASLRGTTPANPKPPEGDPIAPWPGRE